MNETLSGLRDIRRGMLRPGAANEVHRPADHEARIVAHERRIHGHPCPCGSGKTYGGCCIDKLNQEYLELQHRQRMGLSDEDL